VRRNIFLGLIIFIVLISSCTSTAKKQVPAGAHTPQMEATNTRWVFKYETETRMPTSTLYVSRTPTPSPSITPTLPTRTPTATSTDIIWEQMPKLSQLILSTDELAALELYATFATNFTLTDISDELVNDCQLDCVKTKYTYEDGSVIMMMIRTKSHEQAEKISANFRESFLETSFMPYEYTGDPDMVKEKESWMIMSHANWNEEELFFTDYAGMAYDDVVILMIQKQIYCFEDTEYGYVCGDDVSSIAADTSRIFSKQVDKLRAAGYAE
jgi:hypothetical protein